jgi:hypothetical protein
MSLRQEFAGAGRSLPAAIDWHFYGVVRSVFIVGRKFLVIYIRLVVARFLNWIK